MSKKRKLIETIANFLDDSNEEPKKRHIIYSSDEEDQDSVPTTNTQESDIDILSLIGEPCLKKNSLEINSKLAELWQSLITKGLDKDSKRGIVEKIPFITNCPLNAPKLNQEITVTLSGNAKTRDVKLSEKQDQIGLVITNLNIVLSDLIKKKDKENIDVISDSIRLLCDLHNMESLTRRAVILPGLHKNIKEALEETQITIFLIGGELSSVLRKSKDLERSKKDLETPLNYWRPSSSVTTQYQPRGGQRGNYLSRIKSQQRKYKQDMQDPQPARAPALAQQWGYFRAARGRRRVQSWRRRE